MKKIFLISLPLISLLLTLLLYRDFNRYQDLVASKLKMNAKLEQSEFLLQNYFMMRIETLQMISKESSPEIKKLSQENRVKFNNRISNSIPRLEALSTIPQEQQLLNRMIETLNAMRETMLNSTVTIEKMVERRKHYSQAAAAFVNFINMEKQDLELAMARVHDEFVILISILGLMQLLVVIYILRPFRR